ncbi:MAG: GH119 / CBM16 [uncultured Cytophagales bacterium]|uniref:GH119 / CBM16 n=1 Tax=uncultured Cytophagales bacterium TaxID=158755 RepID=A0A6J4JQ31_9SPHI|nr:MAG: GH119 / CBM16 [uncultured Cytophagales bacterium]
MSQQFTPPRTFSRLTLRNLGALLLITALGLVTLAGTKRYTRLLARTNKSAVSAQAVPCAATGTILREQWNGIAGTAVTAIPVNTTPGSNGYITSFESPTNTGDNYGARIRGYVCPPATGNYTFWIASDDESELWLSTSASPAGKVRIASVTGSTASREWGKFPSQQSAPIALQAGTAYYIEALHKEGTGGDHLAVGWQLPDGTQQRPIPGSRLSPFEPEYPTAPGDLRYTAKTGTSVSLAWNASTSSAGISGYVVYRGADSLTTTAGTTYQATGLTAGTTYTFAVKAKGTDGRASTPATLTTTTVPTAPAGPLFEAENLIAATSEFPKVYANSGASGGKEVGNNTTTTSLTLPPFYAFGNGQYVFAIRYRSDEDKAKSLVVNGVTTRITLANSGNGFAIYQQLLQLRASENNTIVLRTDFNDAQGADYDYFRLELAADVMPTNPVVNDATNTFSWTDIPRYPGIANYEYSVNRGQTWQAVTAKPQPVGDQVYAYGAVQVRLKADAATSRPAGFPLSANGAYTITTVSGPPIVPGAVLWRLGRDDNSSVEFTDYATTRRTDSLAVPGDWSTRTNWKIIAKGLKLDRNGALKLTYNLSAVPEFGVELSFRILDAFQSTPQMAVFSNNTLAGMIQIAGLNGNGLAYKFKETYRLYIPKEFLKTGVNQLRLEADRGLFADNSGDQYHWWEWDHVTLKTLAEKAREPLHGRYVHMGNDFREDPYFDARSAYLLSKWSGIAYSGNWMRDGADITQSFNPGIRAYLLTMRQLNILPMTIPFEGSTTRSSDVLAGTINTTVRQRYRDYLTNYGDLLAAVETENEPGLFGSSQVGTKAIVEMAQAEKPAYAPHVKVVAPGWAYWPTNGIPSGWERDPAQRRPIEEISDLTNGHSYSTSGVGGLGGSLVETLRTYDSYTGDGFPKDMVMSETGANDDAADDNRYGTFANRYIAVFDREMRGNIGYVDHIMYHAAFSPGNFTMWVSDVATGKLNPENAQVRPNRREPAQPRLKTFRRLALAYATHGEPLAYLYENAAELAGKKAYFRAVNTATLGRASTGASSDKYLMNFVNFETSTLTLRVKVAMPGGGTFTGERYGNGDVYSEAVSRVEHGGDTLRFTETLAPGESVQYILNRKETQVPTPPATLTATARSFRQVDLAWRPSSDNVAVSGYRIFRNGVSINVVPAALNVFTDITVEESTTYNYTVEAFDDSGNKSLRSNTAGVTTPAMPVTAGGPIFEAERCIPAGSQFPQAVSNATASNGQMVTNNFTTTRCEIFGFTAVQANYVLTIRYRSTFDSPRNIRVNEVLNAGQFFGQIQLVNSNNAWREVQQNITLVPGKKNIIAVQVEFGQTQGGEYDYFRLDTGRVAAPQPEWRFVSHTSSSVLYTPAFLNNTAGSAHETATLGQHAQLTIKGTGFRWFSNVVSDMGTADVYIDNVLDRTVNIPSAAFEGPDKLVYEKTGLTDATHTIKIVCKENKRITVSHLEFLGILGSPVAPGPDMVVTDIKTVPANPRGGDQIRFVAVAQNRGTLATPAGITTGVLFSVDGGSTGFSDTYTAAIQPGESVELAQNQTWTGPPNVNVRVEAFVNDIGRYTEQDRTNNRYSEPLYIGFADTIRPTAPASLISSNRTDSTVVLSWNASTDDVELKGYDVYRDAVKVNATPTTATTYTDRGLAAGGSYVYTVRAVDRAGNQSAASNAVTVGPAGGGGDGLKGEYYDNMDLTAFKLSRVDRTVNFNWGTGSPASTIGVDTYSVRWTGEVLPRYSQTYTFFVNTDDGVRLWVNGQLLVDKWVNQAAAEWNGTIALTAGQRYAIRMEYFENTAGALATLQWSSASQPKQVIPQSQLFSTPAPGDGLKGEYYDSMYLTEFKLSRIDKTVNFNWGTGSPDPGIAGETFSARWTGEVLPRFSQTYTFYTTTDDGVRLWVNGQLLVDKWVSQGATEWNGTIALTAGRRYAIRMEYFENGNGALANLQWASASQARQVIPQSQLFSTSTVQTNLIGNPGFETGTLTPWTTWQDAGVANTNARTGTYAGRVGANPATLEQVVTLRPNTRYELRGFARVTTAGDSVILGIKAYGGANKFATIGSTTYREAVVEFTTGATNTSGTVFLYKYLGSGAAYGDDFSLVELGSPTARLDASGGAEARSGAGEVRLYPNPAGDQFTLHYFSPAAQGVKVTLTNAVGRPVKAVNEVLHAGDNRIVVGTRELSTGLYLVNVVADDGSVTPLKVVISR